MSIHYFETQNEAIQEAEIHANQLGYDINYPSYLWTEHVNYGSSVTYHLGMTVRKTGNLARKCLHIILYRMDSGRYELTYYIN